mgnify:CR=1 FL=1
MGEWDGGRGKNLRGEAMGPGGGLWEEELPEMGDS